MIYSVNKLIGNIILPDVKFGIQRTAKHLPFLVKPINVLNNRPRIIAL